MFYLLGKLSCPLKERWINSTVDHLFNESNDPGKLARNLSVLARSFLGEDCCRISENSHPVMTRVVVKNIINLSVNNMPPERSKSFLLALSHYRKRIKGNWMYDG